MLTHPFPDNMQIAKLCQIKIKTYIHAYADRKNMQTQNTYIHTQIAKICQINSGLFKASSGRP